MCRNHFMRDILKRTEGEIKKDVMDALYWDSRLDSSGITVEVEDGTVRLSGAVSYLTSRKLAEELVYGVPGVLSVINELAVRSPEAEIGDKEITSHIKNVLFWNSSINAVKVDLMVKDGGVTLRGTVGSYWEKIKAEEFASHVQGVCGVINELSVVPTKNFDDEQIARRIVDNLERNLYTDAGRLTVKVEKGHVTLSGSVPGQGQKISAYEVVRYIEGVRSIENLIVAENQQIH